MTTPTYDSATAAAIATEMRKQAVHLHEEARELKRARELKAAQMDGKIEALLNAWAQLDNEADRIERAAKTAPPPEESSES